MLCNFSDSSVCIFFDDCEQFARMCLCLFMCIWIYVYIYTCMFMQISRYMHTYIHANKNRYRSIDKYIYAYIHPHSHACTKARQHTHTHVHIYVSKIYTWYRSPLRVLLCCSPALASFDEICAQTRFLWMEVATARQHIFYWRSAVAQLPKSDSPLTYGKFSRENTMLALGVCLLLPCSSAGPLTLRSDY